MLKAASKLRNFSFSVVGFFSICLPPKAPLVLYLFVVQTLSEYWATLHMFFSLISPCPFICFFSTELYLILIWQAFAFGFCIKQCIDQVKSGTSWPWVTIVQEGKSWLQCLGKWLGAIMHVNYLNILQKRSLIITLYVVHESLNNAFFSISFSKA